MGFLVGTTDGIDTTTRDEALESENVNMEMRINEQIQTRW